MHAEQEMQQIKGRIAEVYARREDLKRALDSGVLAPRSGFAQLDATDRELSELDTRFKSLWDAAHPPGAAPDSDSDIHYWRMRAEAHIAKPVMKAFKKWLRASMPGAD